MILICKGRVRSERGISIQDFIGLHKRLWDRIFLFIRGREVLYTVTAIAFQSCKSSGVTPLTWFFSDLHSPRKCPLLALVWWMPLNEPSVQTHSLISCSICVDSLNFNRMILSQKCLRQQKLWQMSCHTCGVLCILHPWCVPLPCTLGLDTLPASWSSWGQKNRHMLVKQPHKFPNK